MTATMSSSWTDAFQITKRGASDDCRLPKMSLVLAEAWKPRKYFSDLRIFGNCNFHVAGRKFFDQNFSQILGIPKPTNEKNMLDLEIYISHFSVW